MIMNLQPWFRNPHAATLTAILAAQIGFTYGLSRRDEAVLPRRPLAEFPLALGDWKLHQEGVIEPAVRDNLRATDLLSRSYLSRNGARTANLFVAYFQSQRTGVWVHSPKHCLPGSGWVPVSSSVVPMRFAGRTEAAPVNRHVVAKGDSKSVVLYWYEGRGRVYASEYMAKLYLVADAIRLNRTDAALVRIVAPVIQDDEQSAWQTVERFAQEVFPYLRPFIPGLEGAAPR